MMAPDDIDRVLERAPVRPTDIERTGGAVGLVVFAAIFLTGFLAGAILF